MRREMIMNEKRWQGMNVRTAIGMSGVSARYSLSTEADRVKQTLLNDACSVSHSDLLRGTTSR